MIYIEFFFEGLKNLMNCIEQKLYPYFIKSNMLKILFIKALINRLVKFFKIYFIDFIKYISLNP